MSEIEIRICKSWDDCVRCEELQKRVWEMPDYRDAVPAHLLITAIKNGGTLVGAFDGTEMVGFAFGFLGSEGKTASQQLKHTSHMLAVLPNARAHGLGAQMKWLQRAQALKQGLGLMTWTYDPLQAVNAHLNLARLGAIARRYVRDAYGEMTDGLNAGMASDRFEVEWYLSNARVVRCEEHRQRTRIHDDANTVYVVKWKENGLPIIDAEKPLKGKTLLVEIPADIGVLKSIDLSLGVEWRERTRDTFERAFAAGYVACDVRRQPAGQRGPRAWYVLKKPFRR